jgi:hypothetical protein
MKNLQSIALLILGFAAGFLARDLTLEKPRSRTPAPVSAASPQPPAPAFPAEVSVAPAPEATSPAPPPTPASPPADAPEPEDPLRELTQAQIPAMRAFASGQAKHRAELLAARLRLDPARAARLAQVFADEAARQVDLAFGMFFGDVELDPDLLLALWGGPGALTPELERELAAFLGTDEIVATREFVKREQERQREQAIDMQVAMLGIPDLTDDQRTRVREVFGDMGAYAADMTRFAKVMREPGSFERVFTEAGMREIMEEGFRVRREKMRGILNAAQMERYARYEDLLVKQALMGAQMFKSLRKPAPKRE